MTNPATYITDHLDTWSSAIKAKSSAGRGGGKKQEFYGTKKLRELILELAVRGLLVHQDPSDEPASAILKKIAAEKTALIKAGKTKKQKTLSPIAIGEEPYPLPNNWQWCRLGQAGIGSTGKTPKTGNASNFGGEIEFIGPGQITLTGQLLESDKTLTEEGIDESTEALAGDILMVCIGGSIGKSVITDRRIAFNQQINAIRPIYVSSQFLNIAVSTDRFYKSVLKKSTGSATPIINRSKWEELEVPIPPLAEQHHIVAKVDELMALCDQLEQQQEDSAHAHATLVKTLLEALTTESERGQFAQAWQRIASLFDTLFTTDSSIDQLKQTILQVAIMGKLVEQDTNDDPARELLDKFWSCKRKRLTDGYPNISEAKTQLSKHSKQTLPGGLHELPESWTWSTLLSASLLVIDCHNKTAPYIADGVRLLRTTNIRNGKLNFAEPKFISHETFERWSARCKPKSGDILITREAPMGETCIIPENLTVCMGQRMMLVRLDPNFMSNHYVLLTIMSPDLMSRVQDKPVGATVKHLRVGGVETLLIPVPPLAEQHRIVAKVDELMALCDSLRASLQTAQATQLNLADSLVEAAIR